MQPHSVAIVLPPRESFSPAATGAVGLIAHALARAGADFAAEVVGTPTSLPFTDVAFTAVRPAFLPAGQSRRYAVAVARRLGAAPPALIEVHNRPDLALLLARALPQVPVSLFLHNDPQGMRRARTPTDRATLLGRLARVVTVSAYLRGRLLEGLADGATVAVLPNCLDLSRLPPPLPREQLILFAGRVVRDKGADTFVRACARALPALPGWRAAMLGADRFGAHSPETPFLRALRREAAAAGVVMEGWRPRSEVLAAMARAAIVVVPSRWPEPFGLTALEAMASGAALLCAPRGGLPEVTGDAAVAIDPDDPSAVAEAIVALAQDPARRAALGEAGRRRAARFDAAAAAAALAAMRRETLAAWPRRPCDPI
jgi:UDP-glucose:(glucosyl)LPS alpha-1,2-glucosyltransferase